MAKSKNKVNLVDSVVKFDFSEVGTTFRGSYVRDFMAPDKDTGEIKAIMYVFLDAETQTEVGISATHALTKALHTDNGEGVEMKEIPGTYEIMFVGKIGLEGGRTYNQFKIDFEPA